MAKRPDDRYPSAGDLGRAGQAALRGEPVRRAERTVATGAALTAERESIEAAGVPAPPAEAEAPLSPTRDAPTPSDGGEKPPSAETGGEVPPPPSASPRKPDPIPVRRRRLLVGVAGIAVVGVIAFAVASSGGGGGGSGATTTATGTTGATGQTGTTGQQGNNQGANGSQGQANGPRLTATKLRKLANENCIASQDSFNNANAAFKQSGDHLAFAQARFATSDAELNDKQNGFNNLNPPKSLEIPFNKFRDEVRKVHEFDREALQAANNDNQAGIDSANAKNAAREHIRFDLANTLGFKDCNKHRVAAPTVG